MLSIQDVCKKINADKSKKAHLLLGNGFSMAYDHKRFSFTNLLESAKEQNIIPPDSELLQLFTGIQTTDFEKVIRFLDQSICVLKAYGNNEMLIKKIQFDSDALKKYLVDVITNNHPNSIVDFDKNRAKICSGFLSKFKRIYTLNYDLLLYWTILQNGLYSNFTDGCGESDKIMGLSLLSNSVEYKGGTQELYYLHGALHFFNEQERIIKLCWERHEHQLNLKQQISDKLSQDTYPLFISEGKWQDKLEKINNSYFLGRAYRSFSSIANPLVIFGTTLKSNDQHIRHHIINGKLEDIFIGAYNQEDRQNITELTREIQDWNDGIEERYVAKLHNRQDREKIKKEKKKTVHMFDSSSYNPWDNVL